MTADPDDDNDEVNDTDDAFPLNACASTDTDEDGMPDSVLADCQTDLMADPDDDNDGTNDTTDVDDNNNGLIEIHTLDELALLRDDLDGDGTDDGNIAGITSVGSVGCPTEEEGGCVGYELTRSLDFSDADSYADSSSNMEDWTDSEGSGWVPIGSCSEEDVCTSYTAMFDGQGYTLTDLFISVDNTVNGVGLFSALTSTIQNLHLLNANISGGVEDVGIIVGYGKNANYQNLSITGGSVMSPSAESVGGLVGDGEGANLRYAYVSDVDVSGGDFHIGGLVGYGQNVDIRHAYVSDGSVAGANRVGGLVGHGRYVDIRYAYVSGASVSGTELSIGGLVGGYATEDTSPRFNTESYIRYAYVSDVDVSGSVLISGGRVFGSKSVGGLVGFAQNFDIRYAYVSGGSVRGVNTIGGLLGDGQNSNIEYSYVASGLIASVGGPNVSGLVGKINNRSTVTASYWDTQTTEQSASASSLGEGHITTGLQSPITFAGIYEDWGNFWCDLNTGDEMTSTTPLSLPYVRAWNLGTSSQYPALNCLPGGLEEQR